MTQWTTRILAEYVRDTAAGTPDAAVARTAANVLIDLIACAAAGYASPAARSARQYRSAPLCRGTDGAVVHRRQTPPRRGRHGQQHRRQRP